MSYDKKLFGYAIIGLIGLSIFILGVPVISIMLGFEYGFEFLLSGIMFVAVILFALVLGSKLLIGGGC